MDLPSVAQETKRPCISTGRLPAPEVVRKCFHLTPVSLFACDANGENPVGRRRSPFSPAFRQPSKNEGDT